MSAGSEAGEGGKPRPTNMSWMLISVTLLIQKQLSVALCKNGDLREGGFKQFKVQNGRQVEPNSRIGVEVLWGGLFLKRGELTV